jgi:hypothetical protein
MKSTTRYASVFIVLAMLVTPIAASAVEIYSGPGGFSYSNGNFSIGFGTGAGTGMGMFACGASNICQVAATIINVINGVLVPVLFALAFIFFLYGIAKTYIFSAGDEEERKKGHKLVLWGIIAFAIMISIWGLVNVVANTFGLYGIGAPPTPRSY